MDAAFSPFNSTSAFKMRKNEKKESEDLLGLSGRRRGGGWTGVKEGEERGGGGVLEGGGGAVGAGESCTMRIILGANTGFVFTTLNRRSALTTHWLPGCHRR